MSSGDYDAKIIRGLELIRNTNIFSNILKEAYQNDIRELSVRVAIKMRSHGSDYFLGLTRAKQRSEAGKIEFPGGKKNYKETLSETAIREVISETGLTNIVLQEEKLGETYITKKSARLNNREIDIKIIALSAILCPSIYNAKNNPVTLRPTEHSDYKWMQWNEFKNSNLTDEMQKLISNGLDLSNMKTKYDCTKYLRQINRRRVFS